MLSSILRRSAIENGRSPKGQDSPKEGSKEYYELALSKLVGESGQISDSKGFVDFSNAPTVLDSTSCSYYMGEVEREDIESTRIDGRLYFTAKAMYFIGSTGTNVTMNWHEADKCFTTVPNAIAIHYRSPAGESSSHILGRFKNNKREKYLRLINKLIQESSTGLGTLNNLHDNLSRDGGEKRGRFHTFDGQVLDTKLSPLISFAPMDQQKKRHSSSALESEVISASPDASPARSRLRTFSEPGPSNFFTESSKLNKDLTQEHVDESMGLNYSDSIESLSSTVDTNTFPPKIRSNTMPELNFHQITAAESVVQTAAPEIAPVRTYGRQESVSSVSSSNKQHKVKSVRGRKKSKHEVDNRSTKDGLKLQQISSVHRNIFTSHFGEDSPSQPLVILTYSCAYYPKSIDNSVWPLLHGRMFCTFEKIYFAGWQNKKLILPWERVTSLQRESTAWNTIPNAILFSYNDENGAECSHFFGSFLNREATYSALHKLWEFYRMEVKNAGNLRGSSLRSNSLKPISSRNLTRRSSSLTEMQVPADERLSQMTPIANKRFKNVSVAEFFKICWSDGAESEFGSSYDHFLKQSGLNHNIVVGKWSSAIGSDDFHHSWSEEIYSMKRTVSRDFTRTTHLYIGPPVATVHETQLCRIEGENKMVVAISVDTDGIPYSDSFTVEIRLVARKDGTGLIVDVGLFINFKKRVLLASKIRSGTVEEMGPFALSLVEYCKRSCEKNGGDGDSFDDVTVKSDDNGSDAIKSMPFKSIGVRCGLRCILSQFCSLFGVLKNNSVYLSVILMMVVIAIMTRYLKISQSAYSHSDYSVELVELIEQLRDLSGEIKQLRNEFIKMQQLKS